MTHQPNCKWPEDYEHCTCGFLVLTNAYRFANGNFMAFDQFGHQMPYYQDRQTAPSLIARDFPNITIRLGEMKR